jgi:hypothetical protein
MSIQRPFGGGSSSSLYVGTFASRTALATAYPSAPIGSYAFVGASNPKALVYYNGAAWAAQTQSLATSAVSVPFTGSTDGFQLTTANVPGGVMGPTGALRVTAYFSMTNNANNKTVLIRYGSAATQIFSAGISNVGNVGVQLFVANRGAIGSQITSGTSSLVSLGTLAPFNTASENSDADQIVDFVVVLADASDTLTLEYYNIELVS